MKVEATVADGVPAIAVVGMAGRFPQAAGIGEFWDNLCAGRECLRRFTAAELRAAGIPQGLRRRALRPGQRRRSPTSSCSMRRSSA